LLFFKGEGSWYFAWKIKDLKSFDVRSIHAIIGGKWVVRGLARYVASGEKK